MSKELKDCPFCGSEDISSNEVLGQKVDGYIFGQTSCNSCGACGTEIIRSDKETNQEFNDRVDEAWNTRVSE